MRRLNGSDKMVEADLDKFCDITLSKESYYLNSKYVVIFFTQKCTALCIGGKSDGILFFGIEKENN